LTDKILISERHSPLILFLKSQREKLSLFHFTFAFLFCGMIQFIQLGSDKKQTVINKLSSFIFLCGILWMVLVQIPEAFIFIFAPQTKVNVIE